MTEKIKIIGITDGDPFDNSTWSGSSRYFFNTVKNHGYLKAAISGLPSKFILRFFQIINFNKSFQSWKFKYHIDTRCYKEYTKKVRRCLSSVKGDFTHTMQIYSHYDVPSIITSKRVIKCAYQDGNLARLLHSPYGYPKIDKKQITRAMEWEYKVFSSLDIIFTFSEWLKESFINDYNIDPYKIIVVGAGANIEIPSKSINNGHRKNANNKILFVGKDFKRKGGEILIEAFKMVKKEIPDAILNIVGPKKVNNLPDGAKNLGYISKNNYEGIAKMQKEYNEASVFVMPSLYEPYGVVFLEAMANALPCIGANNCAMPEIIDEGRTGYLVPPGDIEKLADKIIYLLKNKQLAKSMGEQGRMKYFDMMTWEHVVERIVECLKERKR